MQLFLRPFVTKSVISKDSHTTLLLNQIGFLSFASESTDQSTRNIKSSFLVQFPSFYVLFQTKCKKSLSLPARIIKASG